MIVQEPVVAVETPFYNNDHSVVDAHLYRKTHFYNNDCSAVRNNGRACTTCVTGGVVLLRALRGERSVRGKKHVEDGIMRRYRPVVLVFPAVAFPATAFPATVFLVFSRHSFSLALLAMHDAAWAAHGNGSGKQGSAGEISMAVFLVCRL